MRILKILALSSMLLAVVQAHAADKVLTVAASAFPDSLVTGRATFASLSLLTQTNEPLVLRDDSGELIPGLATGWKQVDAKTWRFTLRQNVKWHDGKPFTSKDVVFTIGRVVNPQTAYGFLSRVDQVVGAKAIDDYTVDIFTKAPTLTLVRGLSDIVMEPEHYYAQGADAMQKRPLGTGPFVFDKWVSGDRYELKANRAYWGGAPKLDRVVIRQIPEASTRIASLLAGESQIIEETPVDLIDHLKSDPSNRILETTSTAGLVLSFDTRIPPFDNPKVREAINLAIDKPTILKQILKGHGELLQGQLLTAATFGFNPKLRAQSYDPEKAKELLKAANFDFATRLPISYQPGKYLSDVDIVNATVGMLNKIGVKAEPNVMESGAYIKALMGSKIGPMHVVGWYSLGDAIFATTWFTQTNNRPGWSNKRYDDLFKLAQTELDAEKRRGYYQDMMQIMNAEHPSIFLFGIPSIYGVKANVRGFKAPSDKLLRLGNVTID
ncbi:MAG TPA: ABC transporter substrate-binding protein [Ramlibacter sp.]|nr:ABC transporter substrate-binding protein [Ramlibacter sp.]